MAAQRKPGEQPACLYCHDTGRRLVFAGGKHVVLKNVRCTHPGRPRRAQA